MTESVQNTGIHVRLGEAEYRVISKGGWALWTDRPTPGFTKSSGNGFIRPIRPGERLNSYRITHRGTYRGIPVDVYPSNGGRVMATTRDARGREAGFNTLDRGEWVKLVRREDPELRFTTTRTPEPGPWMTAPPVSRRKP